MTVAAARPTVLTAAERHRLKKAARGHKTPHQARVRAQIVLLAARGRANARIAHRVGVHVDTVRTWRGRFAELGMSGLADRKRTGRPASFTPLQAAQVTALACQLPALRAGRAPRPRPGRQHRRQRTWQRHHPRRPRPAGDHVPPRRSKPPRCAPHAA